MLQHPPTSTLFPYTTLFRSALLLVPHRHDVLRLRALDRLGLPPVALVVDEVDVPRPRVRPLLPLVLELDVEAEPVARDRKSTRLNSSHSQISYAVFCLKKKI